VRGRMQPADMRPDPRTAPIFIWTVACMAFGVGPHVRVYKTRREAGIRTDTARID
jgi:hypothetical protein